MTATIASDATQPDARVRMAAKHVYDAECALRAAHQTQVDAWISAAAHKLQESIVEHLSALDELASV